MRSTGCLSGEQDSVPSPLQIQNGKRTYESLPDGTDYKRAVRTALQKEISLDEVPSLPFKTKPVPKPAASPGLTPISAAVEAYLDALWAEGNLRAKTIKGKKFELTRWIGWCAKRHVEELFFGHCTAANGKIVLLREALNVLAAADGMFPNGISDVINKKK
jgi:hypothetical protein